MWEHKQDLKRRGVRQLGAQRGTAVEVGSGAMMRFSGGTVYWSSGSGAHAVWGRILAKYEAIDGPRGVLGFPATDERKAGVRGARLSRFAGGRIYWSERTGAHAIHGAIGARYGDVGGARRLGLPTTDERRAGRVRYSVLQDGRIYWSRGTGARVLEGQILGKYLRIGGHRSWIGLPVREEFAVPGGRRANFEHAGIKWTRATSRETIVKPYAVSVHTVRRSDVRYTYRSGCPVGPGSLRRMHVVFRNFGGDAAVGDLVVRRSVLGDLTRVFRNAYRHGFHVRKIRPMEAYRGDDIRAMRDDNTSAFNCRHVTGNPYRLSQHSYGNAIDINTFENPYVTSTRVYPAGAGRYLDRSNVRKGMIVPGGPVAATMHRRGWPWGARWSNPDYQHFSSNGG